MIEALLVLITYHYFGIKAAASLVFAIGVIYVLALLGSISIFGNDMPERTRSDNAIYAIIGIGICLTYYLKVSG